MAFRVWLLSVVALCGPCPLATAASHSAHVNRLLTQEFLCYAEPDHNECLENIAKLQAELVRYSTNLPRNWTWIIVGSQDWQSLLLKLHLDGRSPAFTDINARQSFLEGTLFLPNPARTEELVRNLGVPADQLLTLAVSHELGHAICHGVDEAIANRVSDQLRRGRNVECIDPMNSFDEFYFQSVSPRLRSR
jgi:hypothetical protein